MVVSDRAFATRNAAVLREAQNGLNVAFGAVLSAYIGVGLSEIDNHPFDHHTLARLFLGLGGFILCLCVGNSLMHQSEFRLAAIVLAVALGAALASHHEARMLGFEVAILRILMGCWVVALFASNALLTLVIYLHHRKRT